MAKVSPAYTIPVVKQMRAWECAVALGLHRLVTSGGDQSDARAGFAHYDPADPSSWARMRETHERLIERLAHERYGTPERSYIPALSWSGLSAEQVAQLSAEAGRDAPLPEGREPDPGLLAAAFATGWDVHGTGESPP